MGETKIEIITVYNLPDVIELAVEAFGEECRILAEDDFSYSFDKKKYRPHTLVASIDGRVVGAVQAVWGYLGVDTFTLSWLCVKQKYQRQGIGTKLIYALEAYTADKLLNGKKGTLHLSASFNPAYYEKHGYIIGPKNHAGDPIMLKVLNE